MTLKPGKDYVGVGCGALVFNAEGKVLLLKRSPTARTDPGAWARPGGALEFGETAEECVTREVLEETGVHVQNLAFLDMTQNICEGQHWVALGYTADYCGGVVTNTEPSKHDDLQWCDPARPPSPLAPYTRVALDMYLKQKENR
mmetsp:Transcript_40836/g.73130  ORF Transcript_40836/g.73130 Transcript_40836/m.73130 type:complete len:144 (-) Transcript_40836:660-1091(-)